MGERRPGARRKAKRAGKPPPKWQTALSRGSAKSTFVVGGMLLSFPGASYLAGLLEIDKQNLSPAAAVVMVLAFDFIMLALLEIPLLGFVFGPDWTSRRSRASGRGSTGTGVASCWSVRRWSPWS